MTHSTTNSKTWQEEEIELLEILAQASKLDSLSKRLDNFKPKEYSERYKDKESEWLKIAKSVEQSFKSLLKLHLRLRNFVPPNVVKVT